MNQVLEVAGRQVTVLRATLEAASVRGQQAYGLSFTLQAAPDQFGDFSLADPEHQRAILSLRGSSDLQGTFTMTLNYAQLPTGRHTIVINQARYLLPGPWVALVDLPKAGSAGAVEAPALP